jgi:hypothetical protein
LRPLFCEYKELWAKADWAQQGARTDDPEACGMCVMTFEKEAQAHFDGVSDDDRAHGLRAAAVAYCATLGARPLWTAVHGEDGVTGPHRHFAFLNVSQSTQSAHTRLTQARAEHAIERMVQALCAATGVAFPPTWAKGPKEADLKHTPIAHPPDALETAVEAEVQGAFLDTDWFSAEEESRVSPVYAPDPFDFAAESCGLFLTKKT